MADEIAQVVDLEYKGIYYLLKGTKAMIGMMATAIKTLAEWNHKKWMEKPGSCSWQKIQEISEGNAPILEFPKEMFEETIDITNNPDMKGKGMISPFEYCCRKNNLRYCVMPDLNPYDDYIPVAVPAQEFGIHDEQIKAYMRKRIKGEEDKEAEYAKALDEAKGKLDAAEDETEKEEIHHDMEQITEARDQNNALLSESKEKMKKSNVIEFGDYLKQGEDTEFLTDPERSVHMAQTCGMVREYLPSECMTPIREESLIPEGGEIYYIQKTSPDSYLSVKRSFDLDDNGLVYSVYEVTDPKSGNRIKEVSDKGCNPEEWKEKLPELLKAAGIYQDQPVGVIRYEASIQDYMRSLTENFTKARSDGQASSKNTETKKELEKEKESRKTEQKEMAGKSRSRKNAGNEKEDNDESMGIAVKESIEKVKRDSMQAAAYEMSFYSTLEVPASDVMPSDNQILSMQLDDGIVEGITLVSMDSDTAKVSIRSDEKYTFFDGLGKKKELTGDQIIKAFEGKNEAEATERNRMHKTGR
ncbi:MAG: hypothetical protein K6E75_09240 [Lachnospiraceae bacterium]|nr:hypothetical protein [Lachnospiraceae bacterium]